MNVANDNDVLPRVVASGAIDEVLALGAILGRGWAADALRARGAGCAATGEAWDAGEDAEGMIRAIEARCGAGLGSQAAFALRAAMRRCIEQGEAFTAQQDAHEAQLSG